NTTLAPSTNTTLPSPTTLEIKPYFSKISGAYYDGGVDVEIIKDINNSKESLYVAMYDFTNKNIKQALIDAHNRGVEVKVVTDDTTIDDDVYVELIESGIEVIDDANSSKLMHNKFLVVDNEILWSGSGNYTVYAFYRNYENYVRVKSKEIAAIYKKEFDYLYTHNNSDYDGGEVKNIEIYFSPDSDFEEKIVELIKESNKSIEFLAFAFTNYKIAYALVGAKERGVEVKGVMDESQNEFQTYSVYDDLKEEGIDVKLSDRKLHSKVFIFDDKIVITGSYNFTKSANDENNENSLVIYDSNISKAYIDNFNFIYQRAQ
ncbi:MAG: hypothetical protein GXN91_03770, partial [Epsilonproteobacteria bacterium]|nr:hypothetical protein [Campylobacterota bacterium]